MMADINAENLEQQQIYKNGLGVLGKHPIHQRLTFLEMKINNKQLNNIDAIKSYPLIVYLDASNNSIEDLSALESINSLVQLNISSNKVKKCLQYFPPLCNSSTSWSTGQQAIGSMLTLANLSNNSIQEIEDLSHHPFLECLILSHNQISKSVGMTSLRHLKVLDLSYNKLAKIEGLDHLPLEELNLSHNCLAELDGLASLTKLSVLNIAGNQIKSIGFLASISKELVNINVRDNLLEHIRQVEFLGELPWLKSLALLGNPASKKEFYRSRVVYRLPTLVQLDFINISSLEKIRARNIYRADGGDLKERSDVFYKYFPEDSFENYTPAFEDDEFDVPAQLLYDGTTAE